MGETRLVDLVGQWQQVAEMLMDPEMDEQVIADTLEGIEGEIEVKANGYGNVIRSLEYEKVALAARKEYVKGILEEITGMDKHLDNKIKWLKENLKEAMIATGKDEEGIKTDRFKFSVRKAGGQQKLEKVKDKVPDNFKKIILEDDDELIREYLKDHTCDWAKLLPRTTYLDMKGV